MASAFDDFQSRAFNQVSHQDVPLERAQCINCTTKDQAGHHHRAKGILLVGAILQRSGLTNENIRSEPDRHIQAEVQYRLVTTALGKVIRNHLVLHDSTKAACPNLFDLRFAALPYGLHLGKGVGVQQRQSLYPLRSLPDDLHRDYATHRQPCESKARRSIGKDVTGQRFNGVVRYD